jgi:hypothetical protein
MNQIFYQYSYPEFRLFSYIPGINMGINYKLSDNSKIGISMLACISKKEKYKLEGENNLQHVRQTLLLTSPAINLQLYF